MLQRTSNVQIGDQSPPLTANLLLRRLDANDRTLIERHAEALNARVGAVLFDAGQTLEHVYFPVDTMVALENFGGVEVAIAGREGMAGWTALGGFNHSPYRAVVRWRDGCVLRVPIEPLLSAHRDKGAITLGC